jgi:hypothetical protein
LVCFEHIHLSRVLETADLSLYITLTGKQLWGRGEGQGRALRRREGLKTAS